MNNFEAFCGGPLFNNNTFNGSINLTICLKTTLLYWIPILVYFCILPFWLRMLKHRKIPPNYLKPSVLYYFKMSCSNLLIVLSLIMIILGFVAKYQDSIAVADSYFILWIAFICTLVSTVFVIRLERIHGKYSSMLMFLLFLSLVVASIPGLIDFFKQESKVIYLMFIVVFVVLLIELIVMLFPEKHQYETVDVGIKKKCPEHYVGVLQKLYFAFLTKLVIQGYRRPLTEHDLWDLDENEKSSALCERLQTEWNKLVLKSTDKQSEQDKSIPSKLTFIEESVHFQKSRLGTIQWKFFNYFVPKETAKASFALALFNAFKGKILSSAFLKLIYDLLQFTPPLILGWILNYIEESSTKPVIIGILLSFLMIVNSIIQSCILHQYFQRVMLIGQRFRTAIIALVYKKSLRLSMASRQKSTVGEMVNLMSVDAQRLLELTSYMHIVWSGPLQIVLAIIFLWLRLGPSIMAGVALLVLAIPFNMWIGTKLKKFQSAHMKLKDLRVKDMNEILNGIKVIKLYAWEALFVSKVSKTREKELVLLRKTAYLNAFVSLIWTITPFMVSVVTFGVYIASSPDNILTAEKAFVSLTLFALLRFPLFMLANVLTSFVQANVSMKRFQQFLSLEELDPFAIEKRRLDGKAIEVRKATFEWSKGVTAISNVDIDISKSSLIAVVGDVGSGKSALLQALLGEMEKLNGHVYIDGSVAYVPQHAWILNDTVRNNITMLKPFNEKLYNSVIEACALNADLEIFSDGDQTEIGERGINLSGGQKQRVSLARAIYANADIYLMDDPLSAVDSHVAKHIFSKVIGSSGLLNKKTRVLVTNSLGFLPKCHIVLCLRKGTITEQGKFDELIAANGEFSALAKQYVHDMTKDEFEYDLEATDFLSDLTEEQKEILDVQTSLEEIKKSKKKKHKTIHKQAKETILGAYQRIKSLRKPVVDTDVIKLRQKDKSFQGQPISKLIKSEHIETTSIKKAIVLDYFKCYGRKVTYSLPVLFVLTLIAYIGYNLWLSHWSSTAEENANNTAKNNLNIGIYALLGCVHGVIYFTCHIVLLFGAYRASIELHERLLNRCLRATMMFFDTTPIGRIINRFSKDIDIVDYSLPSSLRSAISTFVSIFSTMIIISIANPIFLAFVLPIGVIFFFLQRFYINTSRQLKRIESVTRSPIYSHFSESIQGLQCIRAANLSEAFAEKNHKLNDTNIISYYPSILVNRWLAMILETIANIIVFLTCILAVTNEKASSGLSGLSISNALGITQALNWVVRMISEIETNIVGVERVIEYCGIESEPPWISDDVNINEEWPENGEIDIQKYSLRYREGLEPALREVSMHIKAGEKIGIVGRTGAGKSSLTAGLFRLVENVDGNIKIDNQIIQTLGLHQLRSKITVLPQDPVIFSGSLRSNLDPFDEHSDDKIWEALKNSNMHEFVSNLSTQLNYEITEAGENLSAGQRQLLCLTRALLRNSKIIVLDEATAAVDVETDDIIQSTIRKEFKDCTIITIAHRINTILDYDRIAVFDNGELKEFGKPTELLSNTDSHFSKLVKDANLKINTDDQENS